VKVTQEKIVNVKTKSHGLTASLRYKIDRKQK